MVYRASSLAASGFNDVKTVSGTANQISVSPTTGDVVVGFVTAPVMPSGTTGTTQAVADNSTKLATTAYADRVGCRVVDNTSRSVTGFTPTSAQMCGLGANYAFTPTKTGNVLLHFVGWGSTGGVGVTRTAQGSYGTGTAPVKGAAATGTAVGGGGVQDSSVTSASLVFSYYVSGLTLNTAYWFDVILSEAGGAVDLTGQQFSAIEV